MDPTNPRKLLAAMYEFGRTPWDYTSGGEVQVFILVMMAEKHGRRKHQTMDCRKVTWVELD
jgi:hypothetical protein